jgi:hypothetical protein
MVRFAVEPRDYACGVNTFFALLLRDGLFKDEFHRAQGHSAIDVSPWTVVSKTEQIRLAFFNIPSVSRCSEQQQCIFSRRSLKVSSTIRSDGGLFSVQRVLTINENDDGTSSCESVGEFTFMGTTAVPGMHSILESKMCSVFHSLELQWLSLAAARLMLHGSSLDASEVSSFASSEREVGGAGGEEVEEEEEEGKLNEEVRRWFAEQGAAVRARKKMYIRWEETYQIQVPKGMKLKWSIQADAALDISISFNSVDGSTELVQSKTRSVEVSGSFITAEAGAIMFNFDNSNAIFWGRSSVINTTMEPLQETLEKKASMGLAAAQTALELVQTLVQKCPCEATAVRVALVRALAPLERHRRVALCRSPRKARP